MFDQVVAHQGEPVDPELAAVEKQLLKAHHHQYALRAKARGAAWSPEGGTRWPCAPCPRPGQGCYNMDRAEAPESHLDQEQIML